MAKKAKPRSAAYEFKGFDWTEMAEALGIGMDRDGDTEFSLRLQIDRATSDASMGAGQPGYQYQRETLETLKVARAYTKVIGREKITYCGPVWKAISEIKDDSTFLQHVKHYFTWMWT